MLRWLSRGRGAGPAARAGRDGKGSDPKTRRQKIWTSTARSRRRNARTLRERGTCRSTFQIPMTHHYVMLTGRSLPITFWRRESKVLGSLRLPRFRAHHLHRVRIEGSVERLYTQRLWTGSLNSSFLLAQVAVAGTCLVGGGQVGGPQGRETSEERSQNVGPGPAEDEQVRSPGRGRPPHPGPQAEAPLQREEAEGLDGSAIAWLSFFFACRTYPEKTLLELKTFWPAFCGFCCTNASGLLRFRVHRHHLPPLETRPLMTATSNSLQYRCMHPYCL